MKPKTDKDQWNRKLLDIVSQHPILFSKAHPLYMNKLTIRTTWKTVAEKLALETGVPCEHGGIAKTFDNLRKAYTRRINSSRLDLHSL